MADITIRLATREDVPVVRRIVNEAYQRLADMGLNYTGVYQDDAGTWKRMEGRDTYLAEQDGKPVGTVCLRVKPIPGDGEGLYLNQMAVLPEYQGKGIGSRLMGLAEEEARKRKLDRIRLDTAIPATHLIDYYTKRGYVKVGEVQWEGKTYRSVVMEKRL
jgi:predicted N-acetyltransferase YhbS